MSSSRAAAVPTQGARPAGARVLNFEEFGGQQQQPKLHVKKRISVQKVCSQSQPATPHLQSVAQDFGFGSSSSFQTPVGPANSDRSSASGRRKSNYVSSVISSGSAVPLTSKSGCVAFQHETDGRSTFPNQKDFHDFCKQRDLFYGIKEIWTTQRSELSQQHQSASSNYDPAYSKMKLLFQLNSTPTNMNRLALLFLSQCILDCVFCGSNGSQTEGGSANVSRMNPENRKAENSVRKFLQSNPSRLELLRNRVAPNPAVSEIDFIQINDPIAFLKYFIGSSASIPTFSQYLIDHAIHELTEIETTLDTDGPPTESKEIIDLMQKSILLGKMLGYLCYLPYVQNLNSKLNPISLEQQATLRSYQSPPLDIYSFLIKAFKQNRLVSTLPWVVELFLQADPVVQHLPKYKPTIQLICFLYHKYLCENDERRRYFKPHAIDPGNVQLLRLYIENLMGTSLLRKENISETEQIELETSLLTTSDSVDSSDITSEHLDSQSFIATTLLPVRFPKAQRADAKLSVDDFPPLVASVSKIPDSPFPDRIPRKTSVQAATQRDSMQDMLEVQFYKMHPASLRKTVDFVAERIASNFVKNLRNFMLLKIKQDLTSKGIFQQDAVTAAKEQVKEAQKEFCLDRCNKALLYLLDDSLSTGVKSVCCSLSVTKAEEKITKWIDQHVTQDLFPVVEYDADADANAQKTDPASNDGKPSKTPEELYKYRLLILLHRSIQNLHLNRTIPVQTVDQILRHAHKIYASQPWVRNSILNLAAALIAFQPNDFTGALQNEFIKVFKTYGWNIDEDASQLLSARNLMLFSQSRAPDDTWKVFGSFLTSLLRNELLNQTIVDDFCLVLLRQDWSPSVMEQIQRLLTLLKREVGDKDDLLCWTEWVCSGRDDESF